VLASGGAQALFMRAVWLALFVLTVGTASIVVFGIVGALYSEIAVALLALALTWRVYRAGGAPPPADEHPSTARLAMAQGPHV